MANRSGWEWGSEGSLEGCRFGCGVMEPMGPGIVPTLAETKREEAWSPGSSLSF